MKPRHLLFLACCITPLFAVSQFGIKGGVNFAKVTKASNINADNTTGFHAGVFLAPNSPGVLGYRTELIFSRQGYDFKNANTTGSVKLDYLLLPQMMSINITKFVSVQLGGQVAYLLSANADSSRVSTGNAQADRLIDLFNRVDYGAAGGVEVHPVKGLLLGARMNVSFGSLFKDFNATTARPNFFPNINAKNNVVQVFAGYIF